jgi:hypothetical protein
MFFFLLGEVRQQSFPLSLLGSQSNFQQIIDRNTWLNIIIHNSLNGDILFHETKKRKKGDLAFGSGFVSSSSSPFFSDPLSSHVTISSSLRSPFQGDQRVSMEDRQQLGVDINQWIGEDQRRLLGTDLQSREDEVRNGS